MEIIKKVSMIASDILPLLGIIVLIVALVILIKVGKLLKHVNKTLDGVDVDVDIAKNYLDDLKYTVKTVDNLAMTVESLRFTGDKIVRKTVNKWNQEYENIKSMLVVLLDKITPKTNSKSKGAIEEDKKEEI